MTEPVTWLRADLFTGEIAEFETTTKIRPGCFQRAGATTAVLVATANPIQWMRKLRRSHKHAVFLIPSCIRREAPKAIVRSELSRELPSSAFQVVDDSRVHEVLDQEKNLTSRTEGLSRSMRTGTSLPSTSILITSTSKSTSPEIS